MYVGVIGCSRILSIASSTQIGLSLYMSSGVSSWSV